MKRIFLLVPLFTIYSLYGMEKPTIERIKVNLEDQDDWKDEDGDYVRYHMEKHLIYALNTRRANHQNTIHVGVTKYLHPTRFDISGTETTIADGEKVIKQVQPDQVIVARLKQKIEDYEAKLQSAATKRLLNTHKSS